MAKATRKPSVKKETPPADGTIVINQMPLVLRAADRTRKDIGDWWTDFQIAEKSVYPNRTRLYDLYSTIKIDGHLSGIVDKRIGNIINKNICFKNAEGEEVEEMEAITDSAEFRRLLKELMLQKFWGIAGFEFIPGAEFTFNSIPRKHIKPDKYLITGEQNGQTGFNYTGVWNIWVIGDKDDLGIYLKCCPYVIWKKGNMGDWAQYIEIFGQPFVVGKYNGFDVKTKEELFNTLQSFGGSNRMMIPNEAAIELIDGKTSNGNGDLQDKFRTACNQELSVIVLGATETTVSSSSSGHAQSKEHGEQQDIITKADMIDMMDWLNSEKFISILRSYGLPVDGGYFKFEEQQDLAEVKKRLEILQMVAKNTPVDDDEFYNISGIPKPKNYDVLKEERKANKPSTEDEPGNNNNDADPVTDTPAKPAKKKMDKQEENLNAVLSQLSFWQKIKALFTKAP